MQLNFLNPLICCTTPSNDLPEDERDVEKPPKASSDKPVDDYDPHDYGKQQHPTIFWGPVFHLLKTIVGTGILALPYTFKSVGYGVAIFGTLLVGFLYVHVLHVLLDVEYSLCKKLKKPNLTYVGIVEHSFEQGPRFVRRFTGAAKSLVYFHYVVNKSTTNSVYLITIASNFKIIVDHYYGTNMNVVTLMTIFIIPLTGLSLIRNLKFLVPLSTLTNIFNIVNVILILLISTDYNGSADLKAIADITQFPNFFGIVLGSLDCTGLTLPMKNDMKEPKRFTAFFGVLNIALCASTLLYCAFGVLGYNKYGDRLQPNILFNLPPDQMISLVILSLYSLAICISFTLFVYIGFDTLWSNVFADKKIRHPVATEYALRIALCILPYCIAVALPDFKIMVALGGVIGILMDEAVPPILHVLLLLKRKPKTFQVYLILLKDMGLILICLFLFIAALVEVAASIVDFYSQM